MAGKERRLEREIGAGAALGAQGDDAEIVMRER